METKTIRSSMPLSILFGLLGFVCALVVFYFISLQIHFEYHDVAGIVSRVSIDRYPKQQDLFYFYLAILIIPALTTIFWWALNFVILRINPLKLNHQSQSQPKLYDSDKLREGRNKNQSRKCLGFQIIDYLIIPILIYFFFYGVVIDQGPYTNRIHGDIDLFHEGERLAPLNELLRGKIPYRDIYIQHGLFQNAYKPLLASKLFGVSVFADRLFNKLLEPSVYVFVYILGRQLFKTRIFALILPIIFCGRGMWISDRYILSFLSIALLAAYLNKLPGLSPIGKQRNQLVIRLRRSWQLITAGLFTGLALFYSLDTGLYTLITCGLIVIFLTFRPIGVRDQFIPFAYTLGLIIGIAPFGLYFLANGALDDLIQNSFIQSYYQLQIWGHPFPSLKLRLSQLLSGYGLTKTELGEIMWWYVPIMFYLATASVLLIRGIARKFNANDQSILLAWLAGVISFRTALGKSDMTHLEYSLPYFWICYMLILERLGIYVYQQIKYQSRMSNLKNAYQLLGALLLITSLLGYLILPYRPVKGAITNLQAWALVQDPSRNKDMVFLDHERGGGIKISAHQRDEIMKVVSYIRQNTLSSESIFDFSNQGGYYFLADRPSATRYQQIVYASTRKMQLEVVSDLESSKPKLVIFRTGSWYDAIDNVHNVFRNYLVAEYLKSHYKEDTIIGNIAIWRRLE